MKLKLTCTFIIVFAGIIAFASEDVPKTCLPAPSFSLRDIAGDFVTLDSVRKSFPGRILLLSFFQKDCKGCNEEIRFLSSLLESRNDGLGGKASLLLVDELEDRETAAAFLERNLLTVETLADPRGKLKLSYGLNVIPKLVVIHSSGKVFRHWSGAELTRLRLNGELKRQLLEIATHDNCEQQ